MWDLFSADTRSAFLLFSTALVVAFLGSGHCIGMCGAIAIHARTGKGFSYQSGRLFGYLAIGGTVGLLGKSFFQFFSRNPSAEIAILFLVTALLATQAYAVWRGSPDASPAAGVYRSIHRRILTPLGLEWVGTRLRRSGSPFALGLATALLPCGVFVSYATLAAASGGFGNGALLFVALWFGTLPALVLVVWGADRMGSRFAEKVRKSPARRRSLAVLLFATGLYALSMRGGFTDGTHPRNFYCSSNSTIVAPAPPPPAPPSR